MKNILLLIFIWFSVGFALFSENLGELDGVLKPESIEVVGSKIYVVQGSEVMVYDLKKELKEIGVFGKEGDGPGESRSSKVMGNCVTFTGKEVLVENVQKILRYSLENRYLGEMKKNMAVIGLQKIGGGYVSGMLKADKGKPPKAYKAVILLNENLVEQKEFCRLPFVQQRNCVNMVMESPGYIVADNKIFIERGEKGFLIEVYDFKGNKLYEISKKEETLNLNSDDKKRILEDFKADPMVQMQVQRLGGWNNFKKRLDFVYPEQFPSINTIETDGKVLLVRTYKTDSKGSEECILMDFEGKEIKRFFKKLPQPGFMERYFGRAVKKYDFEDGKFYYLHDNEEEEIVELHCQKIY